VAIRDVNNIEELSAKLAAIVRKPQAASTIGARGRKFALDRQSGIAFPERLEAILHAAAARTGPALGPRKVQPPDLDDIQPDRFPITRIAVSTLADVGRTAPTKDQSADELAHCQKVLVELEEVITAGQSTLRSLAWALEVEASIAFAENQCAPPSDVDFDPLFRLRLDSGSIEMCKLAGLVAVRERHLRILRFDHDISQYRGIRSTADLPDSPTPGASHVVVFHKEARRDPLLVDRFTARILELSDGTRTNAEIVRQMTQEFDEVESLDHLNWIENLFLSGLLRLQTKY
jgi:hypothetical protein